jgi:translation initiation factor 4E
VIFGEIEYLLIENFKSKSKVSLSNKQNSPSTMPITTKDVILFFISSVLVSTETSEIKPLAKDERQRSRSTSSSDRDNSLDEAGSDSIELREEGAPLQMLNSRWTFWFQNSENVKKCANKEDYLKELKRGGTFHTIPNFWKSWNECLSLCNFRNDGDVTYHLFKTGIKPLYEDPQNINGGKWIVVLPRSTPMEILVKHWISLMLSLLINEWALENEICGAALSIRPWGNMFTIWNKNAKSKTEIELIGEKLREQFELEDIKYQRHQTKLRRITTYTRSRSDSRSNSDHSGSEEEREGSGRTSPVSVPDMKDLSISKHVDIAPEVGKSLPVTQPMPLNVVKPKEKEQVLPSVEMKKEESIVLKVEIAVQNEESVNKRRRRKKHGKKSASNTSSEDEKVMEVDVKTTTLKKPEPIPVLATIGFGLFVAASVATGLLRFVY